MFATLPIVATKVVPALVRFATAKVTISVASSLALTSAVDITARAIKLQGEDAVGQRQAESIHSEIDPVEFADDPRRLSKVDRVKRNVAIVGSAVASEVRVYRAVVTPPVHLYRGVRFHLTSRRLRKVVESNDASEKGQARLVKAEAKTFERLSKLIAVRTWYKTGRLTKGEVYLADMIGRLHREAAGREVRADSVEAIYLRLLDEKLDPGNFSLNKPYACGARLFEYLTQNFAASEIPLIRERVLKSWLTRHFDMGNSQWKNLTQGFDKARSGLVDAS